MTSFTSQAVALLVVACMLQQPAAAVQSLSDYQAGIITHYGGKQDGMDPSSASFGTVEGACGYGTIPKDQWPYFSVAALSPSNSFFQQGPADGCGMCFQIECVSDMGGNSGACITDSDGQPKSILVMISDKCPECGADHIDVQSLAFAKLANPDIGRININYRRIECTPPTDLQISVMDFAGSDGWLRLAVDDTGGRGAVSSVHVKGSSSGAWTPMINSWGATWELSSAPSPPLDFKITTDDGEEVTATGVVKQNGGISGGVNDAQNFATGVQFTITDPAVMTVQAMSGASDPMVATSNTPGNSGNGATASSSTAGVMSLSGPPGAESSASGSSDGSRAGSDCVDIPAPGSFSCAEQKGWGKCSEGFFVQNNYCAATCGRCGGGNGRDGPSVQAFQGPAASGGRKLLRLSHF